MPPCWFGRYEFLQAHRYDTRTTIFSPEGVCVYVRACVCVRAHVCVCVVCGRSRLLSASPFHQCTPPLLLFCACTSPFVFCSFLPTPSINLFSRRGVEHVHVPGRLYQVEYAMEAISHAGACLGILSSEGVVLAAEKISSAKLLDMSSAAEKIFKIDEWV